MSKARRFQSHRLLRYVLAGCGWLIVFYEWIHVSQQAPGRDEMTLILVLIPSLLVIHAGATAWIMHNKRLAVRGKRGLVSRYTSPVFSQDHLGRRLILDERSLRGKEIDIFIDGDSKSYTLAAERLVESEEVDVSDGDSRSCAPSTEVRR